MVLELGHFTGTEEYHPLNRLFSRHLLTDGTKYVADEAKAYWLFEAIASHHAKVMRHADSRLRDLQIWFLKVDPNKKARLECWGDTGKGEKAKIVQTIPYTDFPEAEIKIYVAPQPTEDGKVYYVMMLPSER